MKGIYEAIYDARSTGARHVMIHTEFNCDSTDFIYRMVGKYDDNAECKKLAEQIKIFCGPAQVLNKLLTNFYFNLQ